MSARAMSHYARLAGLMGYPPPASAGDRWLASTPRQWAV